MHCNMLTLVYQLLSSHIVWHYQRIIPSIGIAATRRTFSTAEVTTTKSSGPGLFARIGSFLVGAGLTALGTEIYIFKEVREGNLEMLRKQRELEKRIAALEKKK